MLTNFRSLMTAVCAQTKQESELEWRQRVFPILPKIPDFSVGIQMECPSRYFGPQY